MRARDNTFNVLMQPERLAVFASVLVMIISAISPALGAIAAEDNAIQTANYFLLSGTTLDDTATIDALAEYDLLVLPAEAQVWNADFSETIRAINEDIILLAYVPSVSWNSVWSDDLHQELYARISDDEWLLDTSGNRVSIWPDTEALDLTGGWNDTLASFVDEVVLTDDYWDGVFYDEVNDSISWVGDVSLSSSNGDVDDSWVDAYTELFEKTRELVGENKIIISNGSSQDQHAPHVNGRMFESFPTPWEGDGSWDTVMDRYLAMEGTVGYDPILILDADTDNTGDREDYAHMRFGLTSMLLGNGYYGFDFGTESHAQIWRYDEYKAFIGSAKDGPSEDDSGVWERDFTNGKVIVNPTSETQTYRLDGEYEKLHGKQDPSVNSGAITSRVTIDSGDGLILLRPLEEILESVFLNGAFTRIFTLGGDVYRTGFFSYSNNHSGGLQIMVTDIDADGDLETVSADANQVFIYNEDGSLHASFYPYTSAYTGGVNISVGDLESDGTVEIVTGTEDGGGAHVRVFNSDGVLINPGFFAYDEVYRGGVNVTIGDLNGDGWREIITGAGTEGGPHVRIFNKHGALINPGFFAYDEDFRGGVNVAAGDVNGDGVDEIITGPGPGGEPIVKVWNNSGALVEDPFTIEDADADGLEVAATDLDGDGVAEIITYTRDVFTLTGFFE